MARKFDFIVFQSPRQPSNFAEFQKEFFDILGILDKVIVSGPNLIFCDELFIPDPSFVLNRYSHKAHRKLFAFASKLCVGASRRKIEPIKKIYISRKMLKQGVICGEEHIQEAFERSGYQVVFPEKVSMIDMIDLFYRASKVAGFLGSGLHNILFSVGDPQTVNIVRSYQGLNNYFLVDMCIGTGSVYINGVDDSIQCIVREYPPFGAAGPFLVSVSRCINQLERLGIALSAEMTAEMESSAALRYVAEYHKLKTSRRR